MSATQEEIECKGCFIKWHPEDIDMLSWSNLQKMLPKKSCTRIVYNKNIAVSLSKMVYV